MATNVDQDVQDLDTIFGGADAVEKSPIREGSAPIQDSKYAKDENQVDDIFQEFDNAGVPKTDIELKEEEAKANQPSTSDQILGVVGGLQNVSGMEVIAGGLLDGVQGVANALDSVTGNNFDKFTFAEDMIPHSTDPSTEFARGISKYAGTAIGTVAAFTAGAAALGVSAAGGAVAAVAGAIGLGGAVAFTADEADETSKNVLNWAAESPSIAPVIAAVHLDGLALEADDSEFLKRIKNAAAAMIVDTLTLGTLRAAKGLFNLAGAARKTTIALKATDEASALAAKKTAIEGKLPPDGGAPPPAAGAVPETKVTGELQAGVGEKAGEGARISKITPKTKREQFLLDKDGFDKQAMKDRFDLNDAQAEQVIESFDSIFLDNKKQVLDNLNDAADLKELTAMVFPKKGEIVGNELLEIMKKQVPDEQMLKEGMNLFKDKGAMEKLLTKSLEVPPTQQEVIAMKAYTGSAYLKLLELKKMASNPATDLAIATTFSDLQVGLARQTTSGSVSGAAFRARKIIPEYDGKVPKADIISEFSDSVLYNVEEGTASVKAVREALDLVETLPKKSRLNALATAGLESMGKAGNKFLNMTYSLNNYMSNNLITGFGSGVNASIGAGSAFVESGIRNGIVTPAIGYGLTPFFGKNPIAAAGYAQVAAGYRSFMKQSIVVKDFVFNSPNMKVTSEQYAFNNGTRFIQAQQWANSPNPAKNIVGKGINTFGFALSSDKVKAPDIWLNAPMRDEALTRMAYQKALTQGVDVFSAAGKKRLEKYVANPNKATMKIAQNEADIAVGLSKGGGNTPIIGGKFTTSATDKAGKAIEYDISLGGILGMLNEGVIKKIPIVGAIAPFMNPVLSMAEFAAQRNPLTGPLNPTIRRQIMAGGHEAVDAAAKMSMGAGVMGLGAYLYSEHIYRGGMPSLKAIRTSRGINKGMHGFGVDDEDTFFVEGGKIKAPRTSYLTTLMSAGATMADLHGRLSWDDYSRISKDLMSLAARHVTPDVFYKDVPQFLESVFSGDFAKAQSLTKNFVQRGILPSGGLLAEQAKNVDSVRRANEFKDVELFGKEVDEFFASIVNNTPFKEMLEEERNLFNWPVNYSEGATVELSGPFHALTVPDEYKPMYNELQRIGAYGVYVTPDSLEGEFGDIAPIPFNGNLMPNGKFNFASADGTTISRELTIKERNEVLEYMNEAASKNAKAEVKVFKRGKDGQKIGSPVKKKGWPLADAMDYMINTPEYDRAADIDKSVMLHEIIANYRTGAVDAFMNNYAKFEQRQAENEVKLFNRDLRSGSQENKQGKEVRSTGPEIK